MHCGSPHPKGKATGLGQECLCPSKTTSVNGNINAYIQQYARHKSLDFSISTWSMSDADSGMVDIVDWVADVKGAEL